MSNTQAAEAATERPCSRWTRYCFQAYHFIDDDADWSWSRGHLALGSAGVVGELLMAIAS